MPLGIDPETLLVVGIIGGLGAAATYASFHIAERVGPELTLGDMLPLAPWEGPPLPRFTKTKPELLSVLTRR